MPARSRRWGDGSCPACRTHGQSPMTQNARTTTAHAAPSTPVAAGASSLEALLLQERRATPAAPASAAPAPFIGYCVDTRHPNLLGRVLVRWFAPGNYPGNNNPPGSDPSDSNSTAGGQPEEHWLPCLQSLALREGDRVLITRLSNFDEPVVIGVLDGFSPRRDAPATLAHVVELKSDERVRVHAADGTPLV